MEMRLSRFGDVSARSASSAQTVSYMSRYNPVVHMPDLLIVV